MVKTVAPAIVAHVKLVPTGEETNYFGMSGADLKAMHEDGDEAAGAEIARRKSNRALKAEARRLAAA